jgi:hypothetical protein
MVLISHIYRFIYIKNYKVAGTSVEAFFEKYCMNPNETYVQEHTRDEYISEYGIVGFRVKGKGSNYFNHMSSKLIRLKLGNKKFKKYFKFCVVRNPYEKMVSLFHFRGNEEFDKEAFKEFCKKAGCCDIDNCLRKDGTPKCDYFIRYEKLQEGIKEVCERIGIKDYDFNDLPSYKSEYRKEKRHYRDYYDEETRQIVYEKHKREFDFFKYEF